MVKEIIKPIKTAIISTVHASQEKYPLSVSSATLASASFLDLESMLS